MMIQQRSEQPITLTSSQKLNIDWQQVCQAIWKNSLSIHSLKTPSKDIEAQWEALNLSLEFISQDTQTYPQSENIEIKEISHNYNQKQFCEQVLRLGKSQTKGRKLAIIGESCTGKTTFLNQIVSWILENTKDLPVWISIAELGETPIKEYLQKKWLKRVAKTEDELTQEWQKSLDELLDSGRVWLLLDGVEKMPIEQMEKMLMTLNGGEKYPLKSLDPLSTTIQQLQGWTDKTRIILTGDQAIASVNKNALSSFDIFRPLDLTYPEEVKQFSYQWFSHHSPNSKNLTKEFLSALELWGYERVKNLVNTPLKLELLCRIIQENQGQFPTKITPLYQQVVTQYYQSQKERVPVTSQQQQELNELLGKLAIQSLDRNSPPHWIYHHQITELLGENEALIQLALDLQWLKIIGITTNKKREQIYTFWDENFQAYFAAIAINDWQFFLNHPLGNLNSVLSPSSESAYRIFESPWKRVILLWMGREDLKKEDKEAFLQNLVGFNDGCETDNFYGKRAYFLAALSLVEFPESEQNNEILLELLQWSFFDSQIAPIVSGAAKATLRQTNRQKTIPALIQLLTTIKTETIKREIFKTLEKIGRGDAQSITALTEMLETTSSDPLRWQIAETLGIINPGNPKAIATIIGLLETANKEETRQIAFHSLEKIGQGNFRAITTLIQLLQTTESPTIRQRIFKTLETIGYKNPAAIAALVQLIRTNSDETIRCQAAESLEKVDPENPTAIRVLIQLISSGSDEEIRKQAVYSIGEITPGNREAITALIQLLSPEHDIFLRWMAISSLGKIGMGSSQAIDALLQIIQSDEQGLIRKEAIENLIKLEPHNSEAITALINLTKSSYDESIRTEAAENLAYIAPGNYDAITALLQLIHSTKDEFTSQKAAYSLGKIEPGNLEALTTLIQLVQSSTDANVRSLAAQSLGEVGVNNPAVLAALIRLAKTSNDPKILRRTAVSLEQIGKGNREVILTLIQMIKSAQDESCRLQIAKSLINLLKSDQKSEMMTTLKEILSLSDPKKDLAWQKIIWHCAQHLSYPDFYRAWHNRPLYGTQKVNNTEAKIIKKRPQKR